MNKHLGIIIAVALLLPVFILSTVVQTVYAQESDPAPGGEHQTGTMGWEVSFFVGCDMADACKEAALNAKNQAIEVCKPDKVTNLSCKKEWSQHYNSPAGHLDMCWYGCVFDCEKEEDSGSGENYNDTAKHYSYGFGIHGHLDEDE